MASLLGTVGAFQEVLLYREHVIVIFGQFFRADKSLKTYYKCRSTEAAFVAGGIFLTPARTL